MSKKRATKASVSRLLKAAGVDKSETWPSAVRGWRNRSTGYRCGSGIGDDVRVSWYGGHASLVNEKHRDSSMAKAYETLVAYYGADRVSMVDNVITVSNSEDAA